MIRLVFPDPVTNSDVWYTSIYWNIAILWLYHDTDIIDADILVAQSQKYEGLVLCNLNSVVWLSTSSLDSVSLLYS